MTQTGQPVADDFDFVVANATQPQQQYQQQQPMQQQQPIQQPVQQQQPMQQTPIQQHFNTNSVNGVVPGTYNQVTTQAVEPPATVTPAPAPAPVEPVKPPFVLDDEIENLLNEFGIGSITSDDVIDNPKGSEDNQKVSIDNESIAKESKMSILLEKLATERDTLRDDIGTERYEKEQYKLAAEKLQNKVSELIEQKTALEYDENKLEVNDSIKDFVHFYNKRTNDASQQNPDSVLNKRTLAEAVKVVEQITKVNMDQYLNQYYLQNNPQMPQIGNNHYSIDQLGLGTGNPKDRTQEQKKADPKWNPMEDVF